MIFGHTETQKLIRHSNVTLDNNTKLYQYNSVISARSLFFHFIHFVQNFPNKSAPPPFSVINAESFLYTSYIIVVLINLVHLKRNEGLGFLLIIFVDEHCSLTSLVLTFIKSLDRSLFCNLV